MGVVPKLLHSKVYHFTSTLRIQNDWSENPSLGNLLLHSDKELVGIFSSAGLFNLASYRSRSFEILPAIYTGHITFVPS
jgi:hypothetical protein